MTIHFRSKLFSGIIGAACLVGAPIAAAADGRPAANAAAVQVRAAAPAVTDVKLDAHGALRGVVTDSQGVALPGSKVTIERFSATGRVEAAQAFTDREGRFRTAPLAGGSYLASSEGGATAVRLWSSSAAPPRAVGGVLIVGESGVARGQTSTNLIYEFLEERPALTYGAIATAIVVPIVEIADDQDERKKGS